MAEQKKTYSIVRRIIKWIGLGLLTLLIILTLFFQAPWKIITLLAIILAACTVLPKQMRKWFWFGVGAVALVYIIWVFLPEDNEGWRPYTFDDELATLEARYEIQDEENAALIYDEIFETLDTDSNQPEFFLKSTPSSKDDPWLSKDHPEMAEWLKDQQDTIAKLLQAARKDKCHFPIPADSWDFGWHTERLAPMRQCAFLLVSDGNNDIAEDRIDAGLEKYLCIIQMADHQYQQPVAMDFLLASALEGIALTQLNRFVIEDRPTAEQLRIVSDSVRDLKNNWDSVFKKVLESDKLITKNDFCSMSYDVNSEGKVRLSRDPSASFRAAYPHEFPTLTYWQRKFYKAKTIFSWLSMPPSPQKVSEIFDDSFDIYDDMTEPDYDWANQPQKFDSFFTKKHLYHIKLNLRYFARNIVYFSGGAYFSVHDTYLRSLAVLRASRVLIAVKQYRNEHGTWPNDLDAIRPNVPAEALIDPQNNGSFVYKLTGEPFTFYSKGKNGVDEEGRKSTTTDPNSYWPVPLEDDILFWPPNEPEAKEENADTNHTNTDMKQIQ